MRLNAKRRALADGGGCAGATANLQLCAFFPNPTYNVGRFKLGLSAGQIYNFGRFPPIKFTTFGRLKLGLLAGQLYNVGRCSPIKVTTSGVPN